MGWPLASKSSVLPAALYLLPPPSARILQQLFKIKRRETPQTLVEDTCSEVLICTAVKEDVFQSFICQVLTVVEEYRSVSSEIHLRGKMPYFTYFDYS